MSIELQTLAVKLVPGFIAVDLALGCVGCQFCVARRNPSIAAAFDAKRRVLVRNPAAIARQVKTLPSYIKARVPLRIGNDSDFAYQRQQVWEFLSEIDPDYPVVLLTRFPLTQDDFQNLKSRRASTLLKLTLTPRSSYVDGIADPWKALASVKNFDGRLLVTIGPLVADSFESAVSLIEAIPVAANTAVYLKPLEKEGLPHLSDIPELTKEQFAALEDLVDQRGLRHNSFMLCLIFGDEGREDPRSVDIPKRELRHCFTCKSRQGCWQDAPISRVAIDEVCAELGLRALAVEKSSFRTYRVTVDGRAALGDSAYISFRLSRKIRLIGPTAPPEVAYSLASDEVVQRWERIGFFAPDSFLIEEKGCG